MFLTWLNARVQWVLVGISLAAVKLSISYVNAMEDPRSNGISTNLKKFLEDTLTDCTIRTVFEPKRQEAEATFAMVTNMYTKNDKTFILDVSSTFVPPTVFLSEYGASVVYQGYTATTWIFARHTNCYCHMYLIENSFDLKRMLDHFVDFDLRREAPDYIVIWDLVDSSWTYKTKFSNQKFYASFMDYRVLIKINWTTSKFDVSLVCIFCAADSPSRSVSEPVSPATKQIIDFTWKRIHSDHFGVGSVVCSKCQKLLQTPNMKYVPHSASRSIETLFNISMTYIGRVLPNNIRGALTTSLYLAPDFIQDFFLDTRYPSHTISSALIHVEEYNMFTVADMSLFSSSGIGNLTAAMHGSSWLTLLVFIVSLFFVIQRINTSAMAKNCSMLLLQMFGPLTDHWCDIHTYKTYKQVLFFWGVLCFSLTLLYGGELASTLSILSPPRHPKSLDQWFSTEVDLVTVTATYKITGRTTQRSRLAEALQEQLDAWQANHQNPDKYNIEKMAKLIGKLENGFCDENNLIFSTSNELNPFSCKDKPYIPQKGTAFTFVDSFWFPSLERFVFQDSPNYWISSNSRALELQEMLPLVLRRNYFAKLVLPFASFWAASGLETVWRNCIYRHNMEIYLAHKSSRIYIDETSESSRVLEFHPVKIYSVTPVVSLCTICFLIAGCSLLAEIMSATASKWVCIRIERMAYLNKEEALKLAVNEDSPKQTRKSSLVVSVSTGKLWRCEKRYLQPVNEESD